MAAGCIEIKPFACFKCIQFACFVVSVYHSRAAEEKGRTTSSVS